MTKKNENKMVKQKSYKWRIFAVLKFLEVAGCCLFFYLSWIVGRFAFHPTFQEFYDYYMLYCLTALLVGGGIIILCGCFIWLFLDALKGLIELNIKWAKKIDKEISPKMNSWKERLGK